MSGMLSDQHSYDVAVYYDDQPPCVEYIHIGTDALAVAKKEIQSNKVMIFSKSYCPFCTKAKNAFASNNIGK